MLFAGVSCGRAGRRRGSGSVVAMDERQKLDELRRLLGDIDREILRAVERRARLAQEMAKLRTGTARFAPLSDGTHLNALEQAVTPPFPVSAVRPIFSAIDAVCRGFEAQPRVLYCGPEGDFGWMAAHAHFGAWAEYLRAEGSISSVVGDVARSRADFAVVPFESLKEGVIFPAVQAIASADLKIVGEREMHVALLLVNASGNAEEAEKIFVSPSDHLSCMGYLEATHPKAAVINVRSPQAAFARLLEEPRASAAIVPRGLSLPENLRIARDNVGDEGEARVRYGVISKLPAPRSGADATAMLFTLRERPGALHDVLHHFKERSCNLRRIQSLPVPFGDWEYMFYLEVEGHITERPLVSALEGAKQEAKMFKLLGSFPLERPDAAKTGPSFSGT